MVLGFVRGKSDKRCDDRLLFGTLRSKAHPAPKADLNSQANRSSECYYKCDDHSDHVIFLSV